MGIAVSSLISQKTALGTVGHNIANVNTAGYSRQDVQFGTNAPEQIGGQFVGTGMNVASVQRIANDFITEQMRRDTQNNSSFSSYYEYAVRIDTLLGDDATAITPSMLNFFDSVSDVSNDPASVPARQVLISEGEALANRFNSVYAQVALQNDTLNADLVSTTSQITAIASQLANLNNSIQTSGALGGIGGNPNDLLDERDEKLRELSELVGISVINNTDGTVNVTMGTGQALVVGVQAFTLSAGSTMSGVTRHEISLSSGSSSVLIGSGLTGGRLGGLLEVREQLIDPVFNEVGRMGMALSATFNAQHELGVDLTGNLGKEFFTDINSNSAVLSRVSRSTTNTGTMAMSVSIDDTSVLGVDNFELRYSATTGNYTLTETANNTTIATIPAPGVVPSTVALAGEGFSINFLSGAPADGDLYLVTPTRFGASAIDAEISNTSEIAAALPVKASTPLTNSGSMVVEEVQITDVTTTDFTTAALQLSPPYEVRFVTATTYDIYDMSVPATPVLVTGAPVVFNPNQPNNMLANAALTPGYEVVVNGTPAAGDVVTIEYNSNGIGDNRNALLLADLQAAKTMAGGTVNYQGAYAQTVGGVGTRTRDSLIGQEASQSVLRQTVAQREAVSGVNLDEEAADLLKFQQAYEASARIIQVSTELFDTLLNSVG
ncbi:flagellar hook-associated protein FlgK [Gammaproteobacteria bacterium 45_16_T64]|nr:flagellar hook-associated protein FlgK [Gammaproteobacteria bacterium 45_16_T64]